MVIATKCISVEEPKLLQKRMFSMFDTPLALADTLALCQSREFLVGLLRPAAASATLLDFSRSYIPTYYVRSPECVRNSDLWKGDRADSASETSSVLSSDSTSSPPPYKIAEFHMNPELILQITARSALV